MMIDPRADIANLIYSIREQLVELEQKMMDIPHVEPVETYDFTFNAPTTGDYMDPATPTHAKPEGFGDGAYWDMVTQTWMEPVPVEWDEYDYVYNCDTNTNYEGGEWVETEHDDWSNDYLTTAAIAYEYEEHNETLEMHVTDTLPMDVGEQFQEANTMPAHDEVHYEAPTDMPVDAPMPTDMPTDMPVDAPMPTDMPAPVTHDENGNPIV
jgi:hypothetical protein